MKLYPKLWSGAEPVGGSKVNSFRLNGLDFATSAILPDSIARTKGDFSEVIKLPGGDGWFVTSSAAFNPVKIRSAAVPKGKFKVGGTFDNTAGTIQDRDLVVSGRGWALATLGTGSGGGLGNFLVGRTTSGGRDIHPVFNLTIVNITMESVVYNVPARFTTLDPFFGVSYFAMGSTNLSEDTFRQKPYGFIYANISPGVWGFTTIGTPTQPGDGSVQAFQLNKDWSWFETELLDPNTLVSWIAHAGELPKLYKSTNLGFSYDAGQDLTPCFPDIQIGTINPESSFPGGPTAQRSAYLAQLELQALWTDGITHLQLTPISRRQVLITTYYKYNIGGDFGTTVTLWDVEAGSVINQWLLRTGTNDRYGVFPLGQGAWIQYQLTPGFNPNPTLFNFQVTTDYGATFHAVTPQADFRAFAVTQKCYLQAVGGNPPVKPVIYYVAQVAGAKELWVTKDLYTTSKKAAELAPADIVIHPKDYDFVTWVGNAGKLQPAPIDPMFPWRKDVRIGIPEWWWDGVAH